MRRALLILSAETSLDAALPLLESLGLELRSQQERSDDAYCEYHFVAVAGGELLWREDHVLGVQLLAAQGLQPTLGLERLAAAFPSLSWSTALAAAEGAQTVQQRIVSLGPLLALVGELTTDPAEAEPVALDAAFALLVARLQDPEPGVRRAALATVGYFVHPAVAELLASLAADPSWAAEIGRQLRVRTPQTIPAVPASESASALDPAPYRERAVASRQAGQRLSALIELRTALALARRQGHRLPPILIELETLRQELATSPPVVIDEPISASTLLAPLSHLLAAELFHPAEELAGALLDEAQPPSLLASLPSLLALRVPLLSGLAAAQHGRGRSDLALAPLEQALTLINEELAAAPHRAELWLTRAELLGRLAAVVPLP